MIRVPCYTVDAFTSRVFSGNPAAVCPLPRWPPDSILQNIAAENNLSETAFFVKEADGFRLRWFTPALEVDLCGHATLASAFVCFSELGAGNAPVRFHSKSGWLTVQRRGEILELDFPSRPPLPCQVPPRLIAGLGCIPREVFKSRDYLAVFETPAEVAGLQPDMRQLVEVDSLGVIATAPGNDADFVSRFFAPRAGVPEDPVTGSAHCSLIPFWAERLGKEELFARQISKRGGELYCRALGARVGIGGRAVLYARGEILLPDSVGVEGE
jgi:predicted PhzF superfamily epimerase YddE/YHI9